jgi:hypothetical protein
MLFECCPRFTVLLWEKSMPYDISNIIGVKSIPKLLKKQMGPSAPTLDDILQMFKLIGVTNSINNLLVVLPHFNETA